jgi:NAD(P)-dependent dehydrogenase (short-subunit alcohol dehydrogenase family)
VLLRGKVAIVSGIGPGMGRDISLALAREGADIVLGARTESKLVEVAKEVEALGRKALPVVTDIEDEDACQNIAEKAVAELGGIDVLVNNAFWQPPFETIEDASMETWQKAFNINLFGGVRMTKACIPALRKSDAASVVFIASMSARKIEPEFGAYAATKAAILSAVRTLAVELGKDKIRVNSVLPGFIWGDSVEWYFKWLAEQKGITPEEQYDSVASETALNHLPTSAEIADSVVFFASPLSRVVTGQTLDVNGGHWFGP